MTRRPVLLLLKANVRAHTRRHRGRLVFVRDYRTRVPPAEERAATLRDAKQMDLFAQPPRRAEPERASFEEDAPAPRAPSGLAEDDAPLHHASVRELGFPPPLAAPLFLFNSDAPLKAHLAYRAAKAGDKVAAEALIRDLAAPLANRATAAFPPDTIFVAPDAKEASGDNAIPGTLAAAIAIEADGCADRAIVQTNRAYHTGADPMERLIARAHFEGAVEPGRRYVLVDDVTTMGSTLADLAHHVQAGGGILAGVVVLASTSRTGRLSPPRRFTDEIERRFGDEVRSLFGIAPSALTSDEAQYLIGFRNADEIRNRATKAAQERRNRLRAKGISERLG